MCLVCFVGNSCPPPRAWPCREGVPTKHTKHTKASAGSRSGWHVSKGKDVMLRPTTDTSLSTRFMGSKGELLQPKIQFLTGDIDGLGGSGNPCVSSCCKCVFGKLALTLTLSPVERELAGPRSTFCSRQPAGTPKGRPQISSIRPLTEAK